MNNQVVTVNLVPGLSTPAVVRVSQYDYGRPITFNILDGTSTASIGSSATVTVEGTKPSGLGFSEAATLASGSTVTINATYAMTQEAGMIPAELRIVQSGSGDIGTANFILAVEATPHAEGTTDGTQETMASLETRLQTQINSLDTRVDDLEAGQSGGSGITTEIKTALLNCFAHVAWVDANGQDYYDALELALNSGNLSVSLTLSQVSSSNSATTVGYGESYTTTLTASTGYTLNTVSVTMGGDDITSSVYTSGTISIPSVTGNIVITATAVLAAESITATYTQSGTVYDTASLSDLTSDLVVVATYSDSSTVTLTSDEYTLSGTLTEGTSTITVTYAGLTDTFDVTVTEDVGSLLYNWDLTSSLTDSVSSLTATVSAASGTDAPAISASGLVFNAATQMLTLGTIDLSGKTVEMDIASFAFAGDSSYHVRLLMDAYSYSSSTYGYGPLIFRSDYGWSGYGVTRTDLPGSGSSSHRVWSTSGWGDLYATDQIDAFNGKTVKIVFNDDTSRDLYLDGVLTASMSDIHLGTASASHVISIGGMTSTMDASKGDQCYNMTISGIRIYANE